MDRVDRKRVISLDFGPWKIQGARRFGRLSSYASKALKEEEEEEGLNLEITIKKWWSDERRLCKDIP